MKEFINKIFSKQQITVEELSQFIYEYSDLCGIKNTTGEHINIAVDLINKGYFDLLYSCKNCANKLGLQVVEMKDINGNILYTKIQE